MYLETMAVSTMCRQSALFYEVLSGCGGRRLWHADVLEWVWFLNSYPEVMYRTMYGDKDTFRIAFHLAGKAEMFSQVCAAFPVPRCSCVDRP